MPLSVFLVAGEASGDRLGAGLIRAIRTMSPEARFEGVAGPAMIEAGCRAWCPSEALSVMGLTEVVRHLPRLLRLRRQLVRRLLDEPPDVFVGIDAPDFNLGLERRLRREGIPTVHYVSPSIWAWRPGRVETMRRAADRVLCLLPFELEPYQKAGVDAVFVGHPLADAIPLRVDPAAARAALGLPAAGQVVAVLPGSRAGELRALGGDFAGTIDWLHRQRREIHFVAPMASQQTRALFAEALAARAPGAPVRLVDGRSTEVMAAADVVLLASGTATLEAALIKRPMVVAYRLSRMTQWFLETFKLVRIQHFALPNLLAGRELVPEFLQSSVTPPNLGQAVLAWLDDRASRDRVTDQFEMIHRCLRQSADQRAAQAVLDLCAGGDGEAG